MNWTGGRLQRHSRNTANTVSNRQKQHFARVRTRLQNASTPQRAPFRPEFFRSNDAALAGGVTPFGEGAVRHVGHSRGLQMSLHQYEAVAPAAERSQSIQRRQSFSRSDHRKHTPRPKPGRVAHRRSPREEIARRKSSEPATNSETTTNRRKRKLTGDIPDDESLLEASRRRLLKQNDWIGLAPSRPLQMHFAPSKDKERIGKRRKIDKDMQLRQAATRARTHVPHPDEDFNAIKHLRSGAVSHDKENVRIRIGTDAFDTQKSTAHSDINRQSAHNILDRSESMLFDVEQGATYAVAEHENDSLGSSVHDEAGDTQRGGLSDVEASDRRYSQEYSQRTELVEDEELGSRLQSPKRSSLCEVVEVRSEESCVARSLRETSNRPQAMTSPIEGPDSPPSEQVPPQERPTCFMNLHTTHTNSQVQYSQQTGFKKPFRLVFDMPSESRSTRRTEDITHVSQGESDDEVPEGQSDVEEDYVNEEDDTAWKELLAMSEAGSSSSIHTKAYRPDSVPQYQASSAGSPSLDETLNSLRVSLGYPAPVKERLQCNTSVSESSAIIHQSPSRSRRNIVALAEKPVDPGPAPDSNEEPWKKFVFGDEDNLEAVCVSEETERSRNRHPARTPASSLAVGVPLSSSLTTPSHTPYRYVTPRAYSTDIRTDDSNSHAHSPRGNWASTSMRNNAARSEPRDCMAVAATKSSADYSVAQASLYNNAPRTTCASPDTGTAGATCGSASGELEGLDPVRRVVFTKPTPFVGAKAKKGGMVHVSRKGVRDGKRDGPAGGVRTIKKDTPSIYDFPVSDEGELGEHINDFD